MSLCIVKCFLSIIFPKYMYLFYFQAIVFSICMNIFSVEHYSGFDNNCDLTAVFSRDYCTCFINSGIWHLCHNSLFFPTNVYALMFVLFVNCAIFLVVLHLLCPCRSSTESRRLKNIDRRSGVSMEVTVGGVTVVVTDYKPKPSKSRASSDSQSSHDTVTTSSPDNHVSHSTSNSVGSPLQSSESDRADPD